MDGIAIAAQFLPIKMKLEGTSLLFIAHRGESYDAPENTLAAINLAWQRNVDAVEIDVHLSRDHHIVVIHDSHTGRLDGQFRRVRNLSLAELKRLDAGSYRGSQWEHERIPTLREVLSTVPVSKKLLIEIKSGPAILKPLRRELDETDLSSEQIQLIGFDLGVMAQAKKLFSELKIFWVRDIRYFDWLANWRSELQRLIDRAVLAHLDGLDISYWKTIDASFILQVKSAGLTLYVWVVNELEAAKDLIAAGVDGITSDRAYWLAQQLMSCNIT
ncbi:MAG: glycerophosphodiester phosphodiesterase family protein [candidate division KSB1 bacterium]|nr:glycerophosphodiester phosphodiesterase family protein [candidate division KSB1 bacterium]MDZ7333787.1 glycerophosphodiester phosphodiesterase family protein [candidate division KSB1 bacterium]MDZ7357540.1 glycerophosphodiester phosphodiesterase family protein [candidate division KSB1 bacterium]MDZ7375453.1 glycerophosphodiester phosphodiesterase family protein [candidate division KSB1 bacterium]MDZ7400547.1 glycerophosphodiester phosphodiesterase family protein [candidate division KSB1 bact